MGGQRDTRQIAESGEVNGGSSRGQDGLSYSVYLCVAWGGVF